MPVTNPSIGQVAGNRFAQLPQHLPCPEHPVTQITPKLFQGLRRSRQCVKAPPAPPRQQRQRQRQQSTTWFNYRLVIIVCLIGAATLFGNSVYIQAKAALAQYLIQSAWQTTLKTQAPTPPWSWADTYPVAKLSVPQLGISQYVLAGANGSPLAFAPGLYAGTKRIGDNHSTTLPDSVIAGHHNTHFDFLKKLTRGQPVQLQSPQGDILTYRVSHIATFDIRQHQLPVFYEGKTIQLVTCLPSFVGEIHPTQRLVVTLSQQSERNI